MGGHARYYLWQRMLLPVLGAFDLPELRDELLGWQQIHNRVRPRQALAYMTPLKFLEQWRKIKKKREVMCH